MDNSLKYEVIHLLEALPVHIVNSSGIQHTVRCPYCGDSSNLSHGHFSIKIDLNNEEEPMLYRCFKCDSSGVLTPSVLLDLGVTLSGDISTKLNSFNRNSKFSKVLFITESLDYHVPLANPNNSIIQMKMNYVNKRLGLNLDVFQFKDLKAVFNLYDLANLNKFDNYQSLNQYQIDLLNNNYIGFMSANNNTVTFRNIFKDNNMRYFKFKIQPYNMNPNSFYNIPSSFDLLYTEPINIHIAEGIMDIISIYYNIHNGNNENNIYFASCGFGSLQIMKYLLCIGINTNIKLHIYSDNDKTNNDHLRYLNKIRNSLLVWFDEIYIHRNMCDGEKDYGIPKSRINDSIIRIK